MVGFPKGFPHFFRFIIPVFSFRIQPLKINGFSACFMRSEVQYFKTGASKMGLRLLRAGV